MCLALLSLCLSVVHAETNSCLYSMKVNDAKAYSLQDYSEFIKKEFRPKLSKEEGQFNVDISKSCPNQDEQKITIKFDAQTYIIQSINKNDINRELKKYNTPDLILSSDQINIFFNILLKEDFSSTNNETEKQNALKFMGFIFSDAARYDDVVTVSNNILNKGCKYQREKYKSFIRSWRNQSAFIYSNDIKLQDYYLGGVNCKFTARHCLVAPITHEVAEAFIKSKDNEDNINLPKDECTVESK
jgi:hypothetical protein